MKLRITLLIVVSVLTGLMAIGQEIPETLKSRNEVYFSFQIKSRAEIGELNKLISIDDVQGNSVKAYANMAQYVRFLKLGYDITLLPVPGNGPGVVMKDHVVLSPLTVWNYYPTYSAYESLMAQFQTMYPSICNLDTITTLASGRRLLVLKISDNVNNDESEPEFLYTSSMHGDETTGYILMMHLADYLLSNYGTNPEATDLVNNMEIFICPLANPDGTYYGGNASVSNATRSNINGVDLNRNYPDPQAGQHPDGNAWQPETVAFMGFATQHHFVAACNFHGGIEVVNYPWDTWAALHPDDSWFHYISREYADTTHIHSPLGYMDDLDNGVTNGYAWYQVTGGRQDYMNYIHHCKEITIELSITKLLPAAQLPAHWDYNWRSFILLLKEARYGIHGLITDQVTGSPVAAKVFITGHDNLGSEVYSSATPGDYHRPLKAGTYTLEITAPCYQTQTITGVTVADHATLTLNIQMVPGASAAVTTTAVTAITMAGATSGGNVSCVGNSPVTAKGVCWGTALNPVVSGNHTTDGSGPGVYASQITGLSPNTVYHVRAYATNASGTSYGADIQFTSSCGAIAVLPWGESFANSGLIPNCWSQVDNQGNGQVWQFGTITGQSPNPILTGNYAFLNSDAYGSGNTQNADLMTPILNLSAYTAVTLQFSHYFKSYSGSSGTLSYSLNNGTTWTQLQQFTTTSTTNPVAYSQVIAALAGQSQVKFKWNYTGTWGYYWAIDNVQVTGTCIATLPVSVSISASSNPSCAGSAVTFTATPVNGGTLPGYQWKVNGTTITGATNSSYNFTPANGNTVACVVTSSSTCTSGSPATSNTVTMTVNPVIAPSISITASSNPVESGIPVTFSATAVNGGSAPVYQWLVNGSSSGLNSNVFTCTPTNGDVVTCSLTSSEPCAEPGQVTSNIITMVVNSVALINDLQNIIVTGTVCYNAIQTITVAGNGNYFDVQPGGSATMIAGENILYYPGTMVEPGGYLYGYIAPGGPWCGQPPSIAVQSGKDDIPDTQGQPFFNIYPNPTTGVFSIELNNACMSEKLHADVYSARGDKVLSANLFGIKTYDFSIKGQPSGMYLVHILGNNCNSTSRIILRD
jgi:hypothetical protein